MKDILIIKVGALGDVLRTTCILPGLKRKHPSARIEWLTSSMAFDLVNRNPLVDITHSQGDCGAKTIQQKSYDLVVNLEDSEWACELASLLGTNRLVGSFSLDGKRRYTEDSAPWFDMSLVSQFGKIRADQIKKQNRKTYSAILFDMLKIEPGMPSLYLEEKERKFAREFFNSHTRSGRPVVGLNTGAGDRWRFKQLSQEKTAELGDYLIESSGLQVVLFGGPNERERNMWILENTNNHIIDGGCDNSLLNFSALVSLCDVLVSSDSFAMHAAYTLGVKVAAFFGPTSSAEIEMFGSGRKISPDMSCLCCYKKDCDFQITCMDNIRVETIAATVEELLKTNS
jgi:heptosyltransferase-2